MKDFFKLLRQYIFPYQGYLYLNVLFISLGTIAGLFSFAMIIPVLQLLFGIDQAVYEKMSLAESALSTVDVVKNNFYYYITQVIDKRGQSSGLQLVGLLLVIMTFLKTGLTYLSAFFMIPLRTGVVRDIRNKLYAKILKLPLGFYSDERKGDIMSRMTSDVQEIENSVMSSLDMLFKNPIIILLHLGVMISMSWQLTIFVLVLLPVSGSIIGYIGKTLKRTSTKGQNQLGVLLSLIEETLSGLRIIKAFNAEDSVNDKFVGSNNRYIKISTRLMRKRQLAHPVSEFLGTAVIAIVLWYGGKLILDGKGGIGAEEFIFYLVVFYGIINPAKAFSTGMYNIQKGTASIARVNKILDAENPIKEAADPIPAKTFNQDIAFKDVSFKYVDDLVLKHIDLTIKKGKTVALVGQSGSGKTTLVDLLPRFYDVSSGAVLIDGKNIQAVSLFDLRHLMGNVNQDPILFNDTFYNNIAFSMPEASMDDVIDAAKVANAHAFISEYADGYDTNIGDRGSKLSGGQRQRISIARAVLANPPILILDEATSALDTESERLVQDALENLMKNRTTIVIAHRLSTVRNADEICVIHEGQIAERGKHDDLILQDGLYKRLHDMQMF